MHESGHRTDPDEEDERGGRGAGHQHGAPPGTRTRPAAPRPGRPGRLGGLRRGGRQAADPLGHEVPPVGLELAVFAGGEVLPGPVAYRLAGGHGDQVAEVEMGVAGVSRVWVHRFWPFSLRIRFSAVRAAARRLFTVPTGISSTPATSGRLSPEPKARPSTSRWAAASSRIAPFTSASSARSRAVTSGPGSEPG